MPDHSDKLLYALRSLPRHLAKAGFTQKLLCILLDFKFVEGKVRRVGVQELIEDYDLAVTVGEHDDVEIEHCGHELKWLQDALRLSAHVLSEDANQISGQLLGRRTIRHMPNVEEILTQAKEWKTVPWLRPVNSNLTSPGGPLLRTLRGHEFAVHGVAITPDGKRIVSGSVDYTVIIWDMETGASIHTLTEHAEWINGVAVTPDGARILSACEDGTIGIWSFIDGMHRFQTLLGHANAVWSVAVMANGKEMISASDDSTLKIWNVETTSERLTLKGHTDRVWSVAVTPDGRRALSGSRDGTIRVWDTLAGEEISILSGHEGEVHAVVVFPDGQRAASAAEDKIVRLWDLPSGLCIRRFIGHSEPATSVAVTPCGQRLVSGATDSSIIVWDVETGIEITRLRGHGEQVWTLAISPDGRRLVSGSEDLTIKVWDLDVIPGHDLNVGHRDSVWTVIVTPDGKSAISGSRDGSLIVWNLEDGKEKVGWNTNSGFVHRLSMFFSEKHQQAVCVFGEDSVSLWELRSGKELRVRHGLVDLSSDGRWGLLRAGDSLEIFDFGRQVRVASFAEEAGPRRFLRVAASGSRAVVASGVMLKVVDLKTGGFLGVATGHTKDMNDLSLSFDGRLAASASDDGTVRVWNLELGTEELVLDSDGKEATLVEIAPDGRRAAAVISEDTHNDVLNVWDLQTGKLLRKMVDHEIGIYGIWSMAMSPDGRYVACASHDQRLKVWDLGRGTLVAVYTAESPLTSCAISPDGKSIVAGALAGDVHILALEIPLGSSR